MDNVDPMLIKSNTLAELANRAKLLKDTPEEMFT
jgi:hypothetical protein